MGRAFGTVAIGASVVSIGLAGIYWLARRGFSTSPWPVLQAAGLALLLINTPYAIRMLIRRRTLEYGWGTSYSFLWLMTIAATALIGRLVPVIRFSPLIPLAAISAVGFVILLVDWIRHNGWRTTLTLIVSSALFSTWAAGVVWGRIYKSPLFLEMLAADGNVHHDGITLTAFANMLKTYHVASYGLDGIPYVPYHWGTLWMFAQWSNLTRQSVIEFYQLTLPVTVIPFFFGGLIAFALDARYAIFQRRMADLRTAYAGNSGAFDPRLGPTFWFLFIAATIGIMPITGMDALGVWTSNLMISESYAAALPVALLLVSTTIVFWQCGGDAIVKDRGTIKDYVFLIFVLPAGIVALGYLKISLMVLAFIGAVYTGVRFGAFRRWPLLLLGIVTTALVGFTYLRVSLPAHREGIVPLDFLKGFVPLEWWPFFFLVHLFWSALYVVLRLRQEGARTVGDFVALARNRRILDVELVLLIAVVGVAPGLIQHIDGGSAFYFSDVQRWLSVGLLLAGAGSVIPRFSWPRWSELKTIAIAFIVLPLVVSAARNSVYWTTRMLRANAATRIALYPPAERQAIPDRIQSLASLGDPAKLAAGLASSRNGNSVKALMELGDLSLDEKSRTAVFVPQDEEKYWTMLARPGACAFSGHVVPSLTGMAMVDGMPPFGCKLSPYYGLSMFQQRVGPQTPEDATPGVLCRKVLRAGFERVLTLRFDAAGKIDKELTECLKRK